MYDRSYNLPIRHLFSLHVYSYKLHDFPRVKSNYVKKSAFVRLILEILLFQPIKAYPPVKPDKPKKNKNKKQRGEFGDYNETLAFDDGDYNYSY